MRLLPLLLTVCALLLAACGDDDDSDGGGEAADNPPAQTEEKPQAEEQQENEYFICRKAAKPLVRALKSSLTTTGGGGLRNVYVAEVEDPPEGPGRGRTWAVAGELTGAGLDGQVGVWAATGLTPGDGLILGADEVTRDFSEFGAAASPGSPAADFAAEVAESDAGQRAQKCAESG